MRLRSPGSVVPAILALACAVSVPAVAADAQVPRQSSVIIENVRVPKVLRMATSANGELLALSGLRSPYEGRVGVVQEAALADLLLVDGAPWQNVNLVADPAKNFLMIMKDGKVYKDLVR